MIMIISLVDLQLLLYSCTLSGWASYSKKPRMHLEDIQEGALLVVA